MIHRLPARYILEGEIGRGAMGVVYLARDTRLERHVAVKVLPPGCADPQRVARFRREARLLASLSHPHIASLHDVEDVEGSLFLVLEHVPGRTLAARLQESAMPLAEALAVFRQLAEAVEAAHRRGVLHRDLKPSNVALTEEGVVKVLDFGLGKLVEPEADGHDPEDPSSLSAADTVAGTVLGTHGYMSPEQLRGMELDRRADIWAYGCLLYEALSGRRAFQGATPADTIARVLEGEPDWGALPADLPPKIVHLVRRCLRKDPRYRLRDIGEAWVVLDEVSQAGVALEPGTSAVRRWTRSGWVWLAVGSALGAAGLYVAGGLGRRPESESARQPWFEIGLSPELSLSYTSALAISPDGTQVVYTGAESSYVRRLDDIVLHALPLAPGTRNVFFSPDGRSLGFVSRDLRLQRLDLANGRITTICNTTDVRGASWSATDSVLFAPSFTSGLSMVSAVDGGSRPLTRLDVQRGEVTHRWPEMLPGGRAAVFTVRRREHLSYDDAEIALVDLATGERKTLLAGGFQARFAPPGWIVFVRASALHALRFDLDRLEAAASPIPLDIRVATNAPTGSALFAIAGEGTLVFAPADAAERAFGQPVWLDRSGRARAALRAGVRGENLVQSPDGSRIAATLVDAQNDVGVYDVRSGRLTRLTFDPGEDVYPIWGRDGRSVTYAAARDGALNLYAMAADGAGEETRLTTSPLDQAPCDWAPGDRFLLYIEEHPETRTDIWLLDVGSGAAKPLVQTRADEREARVSRDARWLAYESNESGRPEIYVIGFPGGHGRWQVSHGGGRSPRWSPTSDELFYVAADRTLTAVEVAGAQGFEIRRETRLFDAPQGNFDYSVAADGQAFLTLSPDQGYDRLVVAVGWSAALAGRAGDR